MAPGVTISPIWPPGSYSAPYGPQGPIHPHMASRVQSFAILTIYVPPIPIWPAVSHPALYGPQDPIQPHMAPGVPFSPFQPHRAPRIPFIPIQPPGSHSSPFIQPHSAPCRPFRSPQAVPPEFPLSQPLQPLQLLGAEGAAEVHAVALPEQRQRQPRLCLTRARVPGQQPAGSAHRSALSSPHRHSTTAPPHRRTMAP